MAARQVRAAVAVERLTSPLVSIVIPVLNEGAGVALCIKSLQVFLSAGNEIIVVDGGSNDGSLNDLAELSDAGKITRLISSPKGRARQMNQGARIATGQMLLFLHADTRLPDSALTELISFSEGLSSWGRFNVRLDNPGWPYKMIGWFINHRSRLSGIATGDQAIFVRREVFESIAGYTDQPLMEDVDLCVRLKRISSPTCMTSEVTSSARKWEQNGIVKTIWLMWRLRAAYALGADPEVLARQYYP